MLFFFQCQCRCFNTSGARDDDGGGVLDCVHHARIHYSRNSLKKYFKIYLNNNNNGQLLIENV